MFRRKEVGDGMRLLRGGGGGNISDSQVGVKEFWARDGAGGLNKARFGGRGNENPSPEVPFDVWGGSNRLNLDIYYRKRNMTWTFLRATK